MKSLIVQAALAQLKDSMIDELTQAKTENNSRSPSASSGQALLLVGMTILQMEHTKQDHAGGSARATPA